MQPNTIPSPEPTPPQETPAIQPQEPQLTPVAETPQPQEMSQPQETAQDSLPEPRNLLAGFLLMYLFGLFGVHQLYLGRKKQAWIRLVMFITGLPLAIIFVGILFYLVLAVWWLIDFFKIYIYRVDGQGQPLAATPLDERVIRIVFYGTIIATVLYIILLIALAAAGVDISRY